LGTRCVGITEMLRCAKQFGLKARTIKTNRARLARTPLPAIAALNDGGFLVLGRAEGDQVLVQRPSEPRPLKLTRAEFETLWDGRLVLMARRASLSDPSRRFDITWFRPMAVRSAARSRRGCGRARRASGVGYAQDCALPGVRRRDAAGSGHHTSDPAPQRPDRAAAGRVQICQAL
jgi:hypothetical protein